MGLEAWQRSLVAAGSPLVGQAQWAHSHLDMHLLLKCLLCSRAFSLSATFSGVTLRGQAQGARGSWDRWLRWLSFYDERVKLFGRTQALNSQRCLEASYKVLIVTKMTQPPPSLRDLSAYTLFHSSSLNLPLLVSAKCPLGGERLRGEAGFNSRRLSKPDTNTNCQHVRTVTANVI